MRKSRIILLLGIAAAGFFWAAVGWAEEFPNLYRGVRPLGMGGAFITLSDDENAMFYNPAGLNDVSGFGGVGLINPLAEISENTKDLYQDIKDLKTNDPAAVSDFLSKRVGEHQHLRAALLPNLVVHNFAIGVLGQATADLEVRNRSNPEVLTNMRMDTGLFASLAYGFWDKKLQVGVTGKYVQREGVNRVYTAVDIAQPDGFDPLDQKKKESDIAFDLGAKMNFQAPLRPTLGVVVQNVTGLDFKVLGKMSQQVNVGVAINPDFWILKTTFAVQVDDVTKKVGADKDLSKRTRLGAEFRFPKVLALRVGLNGGYPSAGVGIDLWILSISYATYAEELGAFAGQRADRRHVAQLSLGF
ncbi:MAG: hypothetical protein WBK96_01830 [Candidatus Manganitrophaceae bacterium]